MYFIVEYIVVKDSASAKSKFGSLLDYSMCHAVFFWLITCVFALTMHKDITFKSGYVDVYYFCCMFMLQALQYKVADEFPALLISGSPEYRKFIGMKEMLVNIILAIAAYNVF